jgi:hypothetical protein
VRLSPPRTIQWHGRSHGLILRRFAESSGGFRKAEKIEVLEDGRRILLLHHAAAGAKRISPVGLAGGFHEPARGAIPTAISFPAASNATRRGRNRRRRFSVQPLSPGPLNPCRTRRPLARPGSTRRCRAPPHSRPSRRRDRGAKKILTPLLESAELFTSMARNKQSDCNRNSVECSKLHSFGELSRTILVG